MKPLHQQLIDQNGILEFRNSISATTRLAAVGDLSFHGSLLDQISSDSPGFVFTHVKDLLQAADVTIGNLESVLVHSPFSPVGNKAFLVSGLSALSELQDAGFDALTFANNHILDAGIDGLVECLDGLAEAGIPTTGAGQTPAQSRCPVRITTGDINFAFFAYSYGCGQIVGPDRPGCNESKLSNILNDVQTFSKLTDIKIVCLHMDAEFQPTPAPDRIDFCRKLAEAGVQIVLCHHPHVPQGLEVHNGTLIAYSLGNFVFPMIPYLTDSSPDCDKSFLLDIEVDRAGPVGARILPMTLDDFGRPKIPDADTHIKLLAMIAERSVLLDNPTELRRHYQEMTKRYTCHLMRHLYWALGERDWSKVRLFLNSLRTSATNRRWVRHYFKNKLTGR